jgi:hypothetical protein
MTKPYTPSNWYWNISGQIWSSAGNGVVSSPSTDSGYQAFLAAGGIATAIGSIHQAMAVVIEQTGVMDDSDTTMHRITESVSLGLNSWTAADVVAWVNYRRALRAIVSGTDTTSTSIPAKPAYPSGT